MGDFGAARQLQRSEWYWLSHQARLPHKQPQASPPLVQFLPQFPQRQTCCPLTSAAWLTACSHPQSRPRRVLRRRVPPRSPPPPGSRTIRSRAAPRSNLPRSPALPSPWYLRSPRFRRPPLRERPRRQRPRFRFPASRLPSRPRPAQRRPATPRPAKPRLRIPRQRPRRPRHRLTRPRPPRQQPVAPQRRRPSPVPGAPRWKQRRCGSPSDRRRCSAWASASLYCLLPPASWSCACAASDSTRGPAVHGGPCPSQM